MTLPSYSALVRNCIPSKATISNKTHLAGSFSSSWPGGPPCRPGVLYYIFSLSTFMPNVDHKVINQIGK